MTRGDVQRMRAAKREVEPNPWVHSFRALRRFRPNFTPGEELVINAMRRNRRLHKLNTKKLLKEGRAAGTSERVLASFLDWRRAHAA